MATRRRRHNLAQDVRVVILNDVVTHCCVTIDPLPIPTKAMGKRRSGCGGGVTNDGRRDSAPCWQDGTSGQPTRQTIWQILFLDNSFICDCFHGVRATPIARRAPSSISGALLAGLLGGDDAYRASVTRDARCVSWLNSVVMMNFRPVVAIMVRAGERRWHQMMTLRAVRDDAIMAHHPACSARDLDERSWDLRCVRRCLSHSVYEGTVPFLVEEEQPFFGF